MGQFVFEKCTKIEGIYIIKPKIFEDARGSFFETYQYDDFKNAGLDMVFVQDNHSISTKGVLRGLHFQKKHPQGKLVRVIHGEIYDVVVDLRQGSLTYGKYFGIILSAKEKNMFYIPNGFAHGFLVLSDKAEFVYKCTDYYYPEYESGIMWNDKTLGINWPITEDMKILISEKDKKQELFDNKRQYFI